MTQWNRVILKEQAKTSFKQNYWRCVLVAFILALLVGGTGIYNRMFSGSSSSGNSSSDNSHISEYYDDPSSDHTSSSGDSSIGLGGIFVTTVFSVIVLVGAMIALALRILVFNPLEIGGDKFFMENMHAPNDKIGDLLYAFKSGYYGNVVITLLLRDLYIFLWSLLLVIPGIYKTYEYRMVPYLMAEHPEMNRKEAFRLSKEMMMGQKANALILDLSFIGWIILTAITCNIVGIFWVNPYMNATNANLYLTLRGPYQNGYQQNYDGYQQYAQY